MVVEGNSGGGRTKATFAHSGALVAGGLSGGAFPGPAQGNGGPIRLGRFFHTYGPLNGALDNVHIFDTALPDHEVARLAKKR
jgi:hypothetical protein